MESSTNQENVRRRDSGMRSETDDDLRQDIWVADEGVSRGKTYAAQAYGQQATRGADPLLQERHRGTLLKDLPSRLLGGLSLGQLLETRRRIFK